MKRKIFSVLLALSLVVALSAPAFAVEAVSLDELTKSQPLSVRTASLLSRKFLAMSNDEFDQAIAELTTASTDFDSLRSNMNQCGVELKSVTQTTHQRSLTNTLDDSDAEIILSSARRAGESYYHLVASLSFSSYESYPTTKDGVTIYFDSTKAEYVGYNEGNGFRLRSGQRATDGTLVFNFDDSLLTFFGYSNTFYGSVYARPLTNTSITYGADYAHTYGYYDLQITGGAVSFTFGPVSSGSVTVNYSVTHEDECLWQIAALDMF